MRSMIVLIAITLAGLQAEGPVIDITGVVPRNRVREPATSSSSGGSAGSNGPVVQQGGSVGLTILSLKSDDNAPEPSLVFEVRLTNVGQGSLELPTDPNLADFEPDRASTPYAYMSAHLYVVLYSNQRSSAILPGVMLYGSRQVTGTLKLLVPGQSIQIRARTLLKAVNANTSPKVTDNLPAKVDLLLQRNSVAQFNGALHEDSRQIPIQTVSLAR
jgi:hypothetical protein